MLGLLKARKHAYKIESSPKHTLVLYEEPEFFFIDYILIAGASRGTGLGSQLMEQIKQKNKPIILEVDPVTPADPESAKRVRFYERLHFTKASSIQYVRNHPITGERSEMDIFFWAPGEVADDWLLEKMKTVYEEIHAFDNQKLYGTTPKPASGVLQLLEKNTSSKV